MNKRGFTLLELMIVMIIMGVLAAIGVQSFMSSQIKGRDSTRKAHMRSIASALELYFNDKGGYPSAGSGYIIACMATVTKGAVPAVCNDDYPIMTDGSTIYMSKFPKDPVTTQRYYYTASKSSAGVPTYDQYQLYAHIENVQDPQCLGGNCISPTPEPPAGATCGTAGVVKCNYGIGSPNYNP